MATIDYYKVLDVGHNASTEEIRKAYRRKCKVLHPDVNKSPDATRIMQEVNEAYNVLRDSYLRAQYNKSYYYSNIYSTTTSNDIVDDYQETKKGFDPMRNWHERTKNYYEWSQRDNYTEYDWLWGLLAMAWLLAKLFVFFNRLS